MLRKEPTLHLKRMICASVAALGVTASVATASASAVTIKEAGSSLVYPLATDWAAHYTRRKRVDLERRLG